MVGALGDPRCAPPSPVCVPPPPPPRTSGQTPCAWFSVRICLVTTTNTEVPWGGRGTVTMTPPRPGEGTEVVVGGCPGAPHLGGGDIVGRVHHPPRVAPDALHLGDHRGLDDGVPHLVGFLMEEHPAGTAPGVTVGTATPRHPRGTCHPPPSPPAHPEPPGVTRLSPTRAPPVAAVTPREHPGAETPPVTPLSPPRHLLWPGCHPQTLSPSCHPHRDALLLVPIVSPALPPPCHPH